MRYFATFPAGCYDLIARSLKSFRLDQLKIIQHDDSSVLFESSLTVERLIELRFFTSIYLSVDDLADVPRSALRGEYFNLTMLRDGEPSPLTESQRAPLERRIRTHLGLQRHTHLALNAFYVIERSSGMQLLGLRLSRAKFKREKLAAGELRPELAHILCLAAGIKAKHVVLDPFAGHGAIPLEAVRGFGVRKVIAVDAQTLPDRRQNTAIDWHQADARDLSFIPTASIDRVVTDPPWGVHESPADLHSLYAASLAEITRVLKPGGVAVILSANDGARDLIAATPHVTLVNDWQVLVSGKKATVYKVQKIA